MARNSSSRTLHLLPSYICSSESLGLRVVYEVSPGVTSNHITSIFDRRMKHDCDIRYIFDIRCISPPRILLLLQKKKGNEV